MDDPYRNLANAIIIQAAVDYRMYPKTRKYFVTLLEKAELKVQDAKKTGDLKAVGRAIRHRDFRQNKLFQLDAEHKYIERFFVSDWFGMMTNTNGAMILQRLQEETHAR